MGSKRQPNTAGLRCLVVYAEIFLGSVVVVEAVVAAGAGVAAVAEQARRGVSGKRERERETEVRERETVHSARTCCWHFLIELPQQAHLCLLCVHES